MVAALALLAALAPRPAWGGLANPSSDLQIDAFAIALIQNGSAVSIPPGGDPIPFFPSDTLRGSFQLATSLATPAEAAATVYSATVSLVAFDCSAVCTEQSRFTVGTVVVDGALGEIGARNPPTAGFKTFQIDFAGPLFTLFALGAANQGWDIQFEAEVDVNDDLLEPNEGNNVDVNPTIVNLVPAGGVGEIRIGPISMPSDAVNLAPNPGFCPGVDAVFINSASGTWTPSTNGVWDPVSVTVTPGCGNLEQGTQGNLFALRAPAGSALGTTGTAGGLAVATGSVTLDASGALPADATVTLPPGHSLHDVSPAGNPYPRGVDEVTFNAFDSGPVADFANLTASLVSGQLLQANGLPFTLTLASVFFQDTGLTGAVGISKYAYDYPFAAADARNRLRRGPTSNDFRFRDPSSQLEAYTLDSNGIDTISDFGATTGRTAYPKAVATSTASFTVQIADGQLVAGDVPVGSYAFRQATACDGCPPTDEAEPQFDLDSNGVQGIAADGAISARIATVGANPKWGPFHDPSQVFVYERLDDSGGSGTWQIPGFVALGSGGPDEVPVALSLLGLRETTDVAGTLQPAAHHPLPSAAARRGNGFGPGLNIGPELLKPGSGLPAAGDGELIAGRRIRIVFGGFGNTPFQPEVVTTNEGTKLLVRAGGVTTVQNTSTPPQPDIYGYDMTLRRFAFRLAANDFDPFTWMDGIVGVPAPGDFEVSFSSLELRCTGDVGKGLVDRDDCDNPGDDNGNGIPDENCSESLGAWLAAMTEIWSVQFVPEDPDQGVCDAGDRLLEVGNTVDVRALDEPLGLISVWFNDGTPDPDARVSGESERVLDRPEEGSDDGFDLVLGHQISLPFGNVQGSTVGWFVARNASLMLPIWEALELDARLQNASLIASDQSVLGPPGVGFVDLADVAAAQQAMLGSDPTDPAETLFARYTWGATGFTIGLPIGFQPGRQPFLSPRFVGRTQDRKLVVLSASANVDFVETDRTKASFGVSAELSAQSALAEIGNLTGITDAVQQLGILPDLGNLTGVRQTVEDLTDVSGSGLSGFLREELRAVVDQNIGPSSPGGGQLTTIADSLSELNALPARYTSAFADVGRAQIDAVVDSLTLETDQIVLDATSQLPGLLAAEIAAPGSQTAALEALRADLLRLDAALQIEELNEVHELFEQLEQDFQNGHVVQDALAAATTAFDAIEEILNAENLGLPTCPSHPVVDRITEIVGRMNNVVTIIRGFDLEQIGNAFSQVSDVDLTALQNAKRDIDDLLRDLEGPLAAVSSALGGVSCGGSLVDVASLGVSPLTPELQDIRDQLVTNAAAVPLANALLEDLPILKANALAWTQRLHDAQTGTSTMLGWIEDLLDEGLPDADGLTTAGEFSSFLTGLDLVPGGVPITEDVRDQVRTDFDALIAAGVGLLQLTPLLAQNDLIGRDGSADLLLDEYVDLMMNDFSIAQAEDAMFEHLDEVVEGLTGIDTLLADQINKLIRELAVSADGPLADLLEGASSAVQGESQDWPFAAAGMDGYALFEGHDLARLHIDGSFGFSTGGDEESNTQFSMGAALDVARWTSNGKDQGCPGVADAENRIDVTIEARNLPLILGTSKATLRLVRVGFTIAPGGGGVPAPVGASGAIQITGRIGTQSFAIIDPAFAAAFGDVENAIGASAGAFFSDIALEVAFLVGRTCNRDMLRVVDEQADEFIGEHLGAGFAGVYIRGGASFSVINFGCPLVIGVGVDVGNWIIINDEPIIGGLFGGSIFGKGACIVSVRGGVRMGFLFSPSVASMNGNMYIVGGLGLCSPASWTSVPKSRSDDPLCGTVDAEMGATATLDLEALLGGGGVDLDIEIDGPSFGAFH